MNNVFSLHRTPDPERLAAAELYIRENFAEFWPQIWPKLNTEDGLLLAVELVDYPLLKGDKSTSCNYRDFSASLRDAIRDIAMEITA